MNTNFDGSAFLVDRTLSADQIKAYGITRVGDVTGLDTIGLPVWAAYRPNSRSLSVAQGKGVSHARARLTALMEAVEGAVAEQSQKIVARFASIDEMTAENHRLVLLDGSPRVKPRSLDTRRQRAWVRGRNALTGDTVFAPFELVGLDMRTSMPWDHGSFEMTSQGLAAGFDLESTRLHALLELIENDAMDLLPLARLTGSGREVVHTPGINTELDICVEAVLASGVVPRFFDLTSTLGVPVVMAFIPRLVFSPSGPITRYSAGVACRLSFADAALAAILEAAQSRLTDIAGARDDLSSKRYNTNVNMPFRASSEPRSMSGLCASPPNSDAPRNFDELVGYIATKAPGCEISIFELASGEEGVHVVRLLSSGMTANDGDTSDHSPNLLAMLLDQAASGSPT